MDNVIIKAENGNITEIPKNRKFSDPIPEINIIISSDDEISKADKPKRIDLNLPNSRTFLVDNILTHEECEFLINETNKNGYKSIEKEFPEDYRNNKRNIGKNKNFVDVLFKRLKDFFVTEDLEGVKPYGFDQQGIWIPIGISNCLLFSRYESGGIFKPHYDSTYIQSPDNRSIYTIQIYLNDNFEGGQTNFFEHSDTPLDASSLKKLSTVQPKAGTALVFNHDTLHEGAEVTKGVKYIVRVYVMFIRIDQSYDITSSQKEELDEAVNLFYQADSAEKDSKNVNLAIQLYVQGQMMLLKYPSIPVKEENRSSHLQSLPDLLLYKILLLLSIKDICLLLLLNKHFNNICKKNQLWRKVYIRQYSFQSFKIEEDSNGNNIYNFLKSINQPQVETGGINEKNWYLTFKAIFAAEKKNYMIFDFGSEFIKFCKSIVGSEFNCIPQRASKYKKYSPHHNITSFSKAHWIIGNKNTIDTHYLCVKDGEVSDEFGDLLAAILKFILYGKCLPRRTMFSPILFSISPKIYAKSDWNKTLTYLIYEDVDRVYFMNSGLLALQGMGLTSGTVVMFGAGHTIVVPFINGIQLNRIFEFRVNGRVLREYTYDFIKGNPGTETEIQLTKKKWYQNFYVSNNPKEILNTSNPKTKLKLLPEIYFQPQLIANNSLKFGIHQETNRFIKSFTLSEPIPNISKAEYQLLNNIVVTGGISNILNFTERFSAEIKELDPEYNVIYSNERFNDVVRGALVNNTISTPYHDIYQPK